MWYPYYGTWFIGIFAELAIAIVADIVKRPKSPLDFVLIVIQGLRICTFVTLPFLYFRLRSGKDRYDNADAERQSLLSKKLAPKQSGSDSTTGGNGYGGTSSQESETADDASDAGSEDSWLGEQRKAQELIAKRLRQDGNWWTYAKGFSVS